MLQTISFSLKLDLWRHFITGHNLSYLQRLYQYKIFRTFSELHCLYSIMSGHTYICFWKGWPPTTLFACLDMNHVLYSNLVDILQIYSIQIEYCLISINEYGAGRISYVFCASSSRQHVDREDSNGPKSNAHYVLYLLYKSIANCII